MEDRSKGWRIGWDLWTSGYVEPSCLRGFVLEDGYTLGRGNSGRRWLISCIGEKEGVCGLGTGSGSEYQEMMWLCGRGLHAKSNRRTDTGLSIEMREAPVDMYIPFRH